MDAGEILATALDWHQTLTGVCTAVDETVADSCVLDFKDENRNFDLVAAALADPELTPEPARTGVFLRQRSRQVTHPALVAVARGQPIYVRNVNDEYLRSHSVSAEHEQFVVFDAFYEPSSEEPLIGGDWYDAFDLSDRASQLRSETF